MASKRAEDNSQSSTPSDISRAISVFVHRYCFTRSMTHPYIAEEVGSLWVMRDAPRRSGNYRTEEWIAHNLAPEEIDSIVQKHKRDPYTISYICGMGESPDPIRDGFKNLGYRLRSTERLMINRLKQIPFFDAPAVIERVQTKEQAVRLAQANRMRPLLTEYLLPSSPLRQYVAIENDIVVGWVRSISVRNASWCADMFVIPEFRRRGIARAMLIRMLTDDLKGGAEYTVLLAGHTGAMLYPVVGYEQIGTLLLFNPPKIGHEQVI